MILLDRLGLDDILLPLIAGALLLTGALVLFRALMSNGDNERDEVVLDDAPQGRGASRSARASASSSA